MSQARIVEIGGKRYWAGLEWEVIAQSEHPNDRLHELRKELGRDGIRLMRKQADSGMTSLGYARIDAAAYRKAPSLAAIVANAKREPWMGIYQIGDDLWWYIAVREGQAVIPGGDVVGTRAEVDAARGEHQGIGDWRHSVEGGLADAMDMVQDGLTQSSDAGSPVSRMVFRAPVWVLPLAVTLTIALVSLLYLHHRREQARERLQAMTHAAEIAAKRQKLARELEARRKKKPWADRPSVAATVNDCLTTLRSLPIEHDGWAPTALVCLQNGGKKIIWKRSQYGLASKAPPGILLKNGNRIVESIKTLNRAPEGRTSSPAMAMSKHGLHGLMRRIYGISQFADIAIHLIRSDDASHLPGAVGGARYFLRTGRHPNARRDLKVPASPYKVLRVVVDTKGMAGEAAVQSLTLFGVVPTMRVKKIVVSGLPNHPTWRASFRVWAQRGKKPSVN